MSLDLVRRLLMFGMVLLGLAVSVAAHAQSADWSDEEEYEDSEDSTDEAVAPVSGEDGPFFDASYDSSQPNTAPKPPGKPKKAKKKKKPAPYKGVFYNNDFSYLDDPKNKEPRYFGDELKRMKFGCHWMVDLGGEYRARWHHEHNLRGSTLLGLDDDFLLHRTRLYADVKYSDWFRFYGEAIDATSEYENIAPRVIEENRFDALNLFADLRVLETDDGKLWARFGRQEMLYGEQRLISPLDWANTRRTFDGAKLFWKGKDWDIDAFYTHPVPFAQHVFNDHNADSHDQSQEFTGIYASHRSNPDCLHDVYFLRHAEYDAPGVLPDFDSNLFGARWFVKQGDWLFDVEGGYQFGKFGALNQSAGFCTGGLGHDWPKHKWKPRLWTYYDYASGDRSPTDGNRGTFNQLFPLVHKYFGFNDLVARQNIHDLNFLLTGSPTKKWNLLAWYHIFALDQRRDGLYNAPGAIIRIDPTGAAGRFVGQEIDLTATYVLSGRSDILFGYSYFFAGSFVKNTNPAGVSGDADFFYTQFTRKF